MKTSTIERDVTTHAGESGVFTIAANGKAFRALIDGLYANKIESITREIWSNALDAHQMAGCLDRPFEITFPSVFDPTFRVRDFGISLSHADVMGLYTTVFASTKEDSNDQVGKLGLGSKSPFAYTDTFSVTVILDGEKRFYAAMIGPTGIPTINHMATEITTEDNGIEVAFPVNSSDVRAFSEAARNISVGFDVKPIVVGLGTDFAGWPAYTPILSGKGWEIYSSALKGRTNTAYARMGCVLYPINVNSLENMTSEQREILQSPSVIHFPIGSLEITVSREALSYGRNEPTQKSIETRLNEIREECTDVCKNRYDDCKTYIEACVRYVQDMNEYSMPGFMKRIIEKNAQWQDRKLFSDINIVSDPTFTPMSGGLFANVLRRKELGKKVYSFKYTHEAAFTANTKTVVLLEEATLFSKVKRGAARVRKYKLDHPSVDQIVWIKIVDLKRAQTYLHNALNQFEGLEVLNLADIELPVSTYASGPRSKTFLRKLTYGDFVVSAGPSAEDLEDGGYIVRLERMQPVVPYGAHSPRAVYALLSKVGCPIASEDVWGIPKSLHSKFKGQQWVDLYDAVNAWVDAQTFDIVAIAQEQAEIELTLKSGLARFLISHLDRKRVPDNILHTLVNKYENAQTKKAGDDFPENFNSLLKCLGRQPKTLPSASEEDSAVTVLEAAIDRDYPLMKLIRKSSDDNLVDLLTDYVIMCDNDRQNSMTLADIAA